MSWGIGDRVGVAVGIGNISSFLSKSIQSRGPQPSLTLDFAGTGTLDSRITFTRSTTGTYYNSSGVLSTAAINEARFDYNPSTLAPLGLLIEQSSTNLVTYSQDFSNVIWVKDGATITSAANTAPDGTTTGNLITNTTANAQHRIYWVFGGGGFVTGVRSIYAKANTANFIGLSGSGTDGAVFNLSSGAIVNTYSGATATITPVGNGWYRCTIYPAAGYLYLIVTIGETAAQAIPNTSYVGTEKSAYIWGAQLEALTFPTSYIPTTIAQVTRAADNASMTGTNFSSWYNATQGTYFFSGNSQQTSGVVQSFIQDQNIFLGTAGQGTCKLYNPTGAGLVSGYIINASSALIAYSYQIPSLSSLFTVNGQATQSFTNPNLSASTLAIGTGLFGSAYGFRGINGYIKKIVYYPTALTSPQLIALTT